MENENYHKDLERKIINAQKKLRNVNPAHPLLNMVTIMPLGILHNEDFETKYKGIHWGLAFEEYVSELEKYTNDKEV